MHETADDAFYVGYLPLPRRDRKFLRWFLPAALLCACGMALAVAATQKDPGTGSWQINTPLTLEGTLTVMPYALLHTHDGTTPRAVLLVQEGKFGAAERLATLDGKRLRVKGTLLQRNGRSMLEIAAAPDAVEQMAGQDAPLPLRIPRGTKTVRGEVIDPKCYIGAMKPGGGKTHKACAELCLAGGIPPMLAAWEEGREIYYLLLNADGTPANAHVSHLAGETVTLTGMVEQVDDLLLLKLP